VNSPVLDETVIQICRRRLKSLNIIGLSGDIIGKSQVVIEYPTRKTHFTPMMKRILTLGTFLVAIGAAAPASAACYADYKAKRANPLRLHYGVIELGDKFCQNRSEARAEISKRIERDGWQLLNIMSMFDKNGLAERKESAGNFYLRF